MSDKKGHHSPPSMLETEFHAGETTNTTVLVVMGAGLLAAVALVMLVMVLFFSSLSERSAKRDVAMSPLVIVPAPTTAPRLQVDERLEIAELRQREDRILTSYDWVDQEAGVARIPVARAMELLLQKGDLVRPGPLAPGAQDPY